MIASIRGKINLISKSGRPGVIFLESAEASFGINIDSQVLVFSPDSFQATLISAPRPRAVYFNDEMAVGFVPHGEVMEVSALDPKQGVVFYTLNMGRAAKPTFARPAKSEACNVTRAARRLGYRAWS